MDPGEVVLAKMPESARRIGSLLTQAGYRFWVVGGVVRDVLLGRDPKDWDFCTNAPVDVLTGLLSSAFRVIPVGLRHGTVQVLTPHGVMEVTSWENNGSRALMDDLRRRDFTVNAMAVSIPDGDLVDPFGGRRDLECRRLRGVEDPLARFREDPIRVLRASRFVATLGLHATPKTLQCLRRQAPWLQQSAMERIRDELFKLLVGPWVMDGLELARRTGVLKVVIPELLEGYRKRQNHYHAHHIYRHTLLAVHYSPARLRVRLAALFHDIAKPRVRKKVQGVFRFFGHEKQSAEMAGQILQRWLAPKKLADEVCTLVANHMVHDTDRWKDGAVRRLVHRVGKPLLEDLLDLLEADRRAHGTDDADTEAVQRLRQRVQRILNERPVLDLSRLAINGRDVMDTLGIGPGPMVGRLLKEAHQLVLEDPSKNDRKALLAWIRERGAL
ncbi:tRNA nucleotidyltransferase (CCA-adding enzyme) [Desulfacinum hydrothermale DSM 13146]|uniref:tRNA nucleotidyltransferase (CCA-adding enzyme) n=1 Tax=Desulfacinum hydrothermale DSM 13146 TaxID=1121390 RepID=A0A1W1XBQ8_9BACT|nr:CCA tRNA nucleotidyltransferase [Desulfacinum hydrothermale]SMC21322.1 tRNA nucleotidyltransferase (CCA-adding enzyme) [Desulfacinum hydrothermale DSM 13146]